VTRSRHAATAALLLLLPAAASGAAPAAPPPGAAACSGCHPPSGVKGSVTVLQGRPAEEIVAAMQAYRAGERAPTVMDRIAKGFTDGEIRAIAAWLAAQG
jgi:cytochrome subunit of sulfide dehydrogenase